MGDTEHTNNPLSTNVFTAEELAQHLPGTFQRFENPDKALLRESNPQDHPAELIDREWNGVILTLPTNTKKVEVVCMLFQSTTAATRYYDAELFDFSVTPEFVQYEIDVGDQAVVNRPASDGDSMGILFAQKSNVVMVFASPHHVTHHVALAEEQFSRLNLD